MKEKQYFSRDVSENRENENFLQAKKAKEIVSITNLNTKRA
jgi:hypothetical protein